MRMLKLLFVAVGCVFFASCLEINEEVNINENGSGQLSSSLDMSQLIDMMQAMGGEEFEKKKDEKIDSVIYLKDIVDTAKNMTQEQKDLFRDGTIRVKMDMANKEFKINMNHPFNNLEKLQRLTSEMGKGGMGFGNAMKGAMGGGKDQATGEQAPSDGGEMDQLLGIFDYDIKKGQIKKTINADRLKKLQENPKMAEMKQGADMGIEVLYSVTYKLPRAAKSVNNAKAKLSDDKKTVTLRSNLMEIFTKPEQFEYTIEY
ncbi:MAG TPA: hypothetical protein VGD17_10920 [Chitinophagaceae bacterium]